MIYKLNKTCDKIIKNPNQNYPYFIRIFWITVLNIIRSSLLAIRTDIFLIKRPICLNRCIIHVCSQVIKRQCNQRLVQNRIPLMIVYNF
ncbi:hypothetical protein Hanom_Chr05g00468741 [Helianthus anomalus]